MSREQSKGSNGEGRSLRRLLEQSWEYTLAESLEERTEIHLGIVSIYWRLKSHGTGGDHGGRGAHGEDSEDQASDIAEETGRRSEGEGREPAE